ncbi:MAG: energy transducer TonB [Terracidiphilus sp.]
MRLLILSTLSLVLIPGFGNAMQSAEPKYPDASAVPADVKTVIPPKLLHTVDPEFSDKAREKEISGRCLISLIVDIKGMPQHESVVRCTDPVFELSSLVAARQYRFRPATRKDGTPVDVRTTVEVNYRMVGRELTTLVHFGVSAAPGTTPDLPGADGVYPLSKSVSPPGIVKFVDEGYGDAAFRVQGTGACDVVLTVSEKGKPSDPSVTHCEDPILQESAVASLMKSRYKPGTLKGVAVPVRASIHVEFGGFAPSK